MPYNPTTGQFEYEDDTVQTQLKGLLDKNNPLLKQARTRAKQFSNRRGLLDSTLAAQAGEEAALSVALPIASQQSKQLADKNITAQDFRQRKVLQGEELGSKERIASLNVAAHDRQFAVSAVTELQKKYGAMFNEIVKNNDIPADARERYFQHIAGLRDSDISFVEQLYNIDLDWTSPVASAKAPAA